VAVDGFQGEVSQTLSVPEMTYNVFSGTLNPTHFTSLLPHSGGVEKNTDGMSQAAR